MWGEADGAEEDGDDGDDGDGGNDDDDNDDGYGDDTECSPESLRKRKVAAPAASPANAPAAAPAPGGGGGGKAPVKPLHMAGSKLPVHPPSVGKGAAVAAAVNNFTAAFKEQQQADRALQREIQAAHVTESAAQRKHEQDLAGKCSQQ